MARQSIFTDCYKEVRESDFFLYIFIGGRGIGKTYSMLKNSYMDHKNIFYLRRTDTEVKNCCDAFTNPFKAINQDIGTNIEIVPNKDIALIVDKNDNDTVRGYASALSTFGKFRGADFSDIDLIIFDEFINTGIVNTMKRESFLFFNLIETINRNRELLGKESIKVVLLSNANTIDNDIIRALNLADEIKEMKEHHLESYQDNNRGIYLKLLENKEVRDLKMKTKLYRLTQGTAFFDMSLENEFTSDYFGDVKRINYQELQPVVNYESIYFYKHKSRDIMFACKRKANCDKYCVNTLPAFKRAYGYMMAYYIESGLMFYQDYNIKLEVYSIFR